MEKSQSTELSSLTQAQWEALDIAAFVTEHSKKFLHLCRAWTGGWSNYVDQGDIENEFFVQAYPRLKRTHQKHLHIDPRERDRLMMGTLNIIARTAVTKRMKDLVPMRNVSTARDDDDSEQTLDAVFLDRLMLQHKAGFDDHVHSEWIQEAAYDPTVVSYFLPGSTEEFDDNYMTEDDYETLRWLEYIRPYLHRLQYRVFFLRVFYRLTPPQIGEHLRITRVHAANVLRMTSNRIQRLIKAGKISKAHFRQYFPAESPAEDSAGQ